MNSYKISDGWNGGECLLLYDEPFKIVIFQLLEGDMDSIAHHWKEECSKTKCTARKPTFVMF